MPGSQEEEDEEPPSYEDVEKQDASYLPKYHDCFRQDDAGRVSTNLAKTIRSLTSCSTALTPQKLQVFMVWSLSNFYLTLGAPATMDQKLL